jgi:hypothetical protein
MPPRGTGLKKELQMTAGHRDRWLRENMMQGYKWN